MTSPLLQRVAASLRRILRDARAVTDLHVRHAAQVLRGLPGPDVAALLEAFPALSPAAREQASPMNRRNFVQ